MKQLNYLLLILCVAVFLLGVGVWYFSTKLTPEVLTISQETARINAATRLEEAKSERIEKTLEYKTRVQELENVKAVKSSLPYRIAISVSYSIVALWPVWLLSALITLAISQRYRFTIRVPFEDEGIKTEVHPKQAFTLSQKALQVKELRASGEILAYEEDLTARRFKQQLDLARAMKAPKDTKVLEPIIDAESHELPAFTGNVYLSQLSLDDDADESNVLYGRELETGGIVQLPFSVLKSIVKCGLQGQGKSAATLLEIRCALALKYLSGEKYRIHLIDKHYGFDESLASRLEDLLPGGLSLLDSTLLGSEIVEDGSVLTFLDEQIADGKRRQKAGTQVNEPVDIIIFDEYSETIESHEDGKLIEERVKQLFNYRKAKKFLVLVLYESTKTKNSVKGLNPVKMGLSRLVFQCKPEQAAPLIGWDAAKRVDGLQPGQCAIKLPSAKEVSFCQLAIVSPQDFLPFAPFIKPATQTPHVSLQKTNVPDEIDATPVADEPTTDTPARLTPEFVKAYIDDQKQNDSAFSQNRLAQDADITKKNMSFFLNGKRELSKDEETRLCARIFPQPASNVILLKRYVESS